MSAETGKPVILCVDDEIPTLKLLVQYLAGSGYEARTAESGRAALLAVRQEKPDLIFLDILMPDMDGYAVCAQLQEHEDTSQIPVIFVTGLGGEQDKARALAVGGVDYVQKPFDQQTLLNTIRTHLRTSVQWKALGTKGGPRTDGIQPADFVRFKDHLAEHLHLAPEKKTAVAKAPPAKLYALAATLGLTDQRMAQDIAAFLKLPYLARISRDVIRLGVLPASFCKMYQVIAVRDDSGENAFVLSNPFNWELLDALKRCAGPDQPPRLLVTEPETVAALLGSGASPGTTSPGSAAAPAGSRDVNLDYNLLADVLPEGEAESDLESEYEVLNPYQMAKIGKLPPIVRLVNMVLTDAVKAGASDIHIEPQEKFVLVRYRVDGSLQDTLKIPKHLQPNTLSRFKIIAGMDIAEHRKPQDGRSRLRIENRRIDLRVSTLPTQFGEKVVIRLLDSAKGLVEMNQLGLASDNLQLFQRLLSQPQGMILVTGPTGSGKTSTLYSALNWLKSPTKNIITLEDPIEFKIPSLNQVQINTRTGMTFASALRSVLRQDPNIILVGEIRDPETASIALEAAQTGHLLLSTLHTNDAVATITRLLDLGIEPFKVASSVIGILAQRLLRRVCPACAVEQAPSQEAMEKAGGQGRLPADARWKAGAGCDACQHTGFKGRLAIHELLEVTEEIRDLIARRSPDHAIRSAARRSGMRGLMEAGIIEAAQGLTTLEEVARVAPRDDAPTPQADAAAPAPGTLTSARGAEPARAAPPEAAENAPASILILDDDPDTQTLLKRILEKAGYETTVAGDGIEALLYLGKKTFDLILSDINMPNMDGITLIEMNNQKGIRTPVIFLTAQGDEASEQRCLELGAVDFIKKPFKKDILLIRVGHACRRPAV